MKKVEKVYKIGDKIEVEELENVATGISLKGLKVIETSGNNWASRIIEGKDKDTFEDIKQNVILKLIENNYIISKDCYRTVNKTLYNIRKEKINNVEIIVNEDTNVSNVDYNSYIEYVKQEINVIETIETRNKMLLKELNLTKKQIEILNVYSKLNSMQGVADILGVTKSTVQTTIERIRKKTMQLIQKVEY